MSLGEKIAQLRRHKGWTQDEFAHKVGVHGRHISRWERNINRPSGKVLGKIAEVFKTTVDDLTQDHSTPELQALLPDSDLFTQFQKIAKLDEEEKKAVKMILQAVITKHEMKNLVQK